MKISIERAPVHRTLASIAHLVDRVKVLPILGNVKWQFGPERMTLTTTDTELQMVAQLPLPADEPLPQVYETTVDAQKLLDIFGSVKDETFALEFKDGVLVIRADRSRFSLVTLSPEGFPVLDLSRHQNTLNIPQATLKRLIRRVAFAVSEKEIRIPLKGVLVDVDGGSVSVVATDGHRLAIASTQLNDGEAGTFSAIIPRKAVIEIERLLDDDSEHFIALSISENYVSFKLERAENLTFASKLIIGTFPAYQAVVPRDNPHTYTASVEEMKGALKQATLINREAIRQVRFNIDAEKTVICCSNAAQEEAEITIESTFDGAPLSIVFNEQYLQQALSSLDQEMVTMAISSANNSVLIREENDLIQTQYVIMPMIV